MSASSLRSDVDGSVLTLTLSRPQALNAFDEDLHVELASVLEGLVEMTEVRAVVLASTGRVFSAGGSFDLMRTAHADPAARRSIIDTARRLLLALWSVPQPIVVALNGPAIGLGATVALSCDAVVAAKSASLADTHVSVGLVAGDGGCVVWPALAGSLVAKRHLLSGDPVDAAAALRLGLVTDVVETAEDALESATRLAHRIASLPPIAVQLTKRALNHQFVERGADVLELALGFEERTLASADMLEAIAAFEERRPGVFSGA